MTMTNELVAVTIIPFGTTIKKLGEKTRNISCVFLIILLNLTTDCHEKKAVQAVQVMPIVYVQNIMTSAIT